MESEKLKESSDSEPSPDENTESKKGRTHSIQSCHQVWGQRIMREYKELIDEGPWGIFADMNEDDISQWSIFIFGPPESLYTLGVFKGVLTFSDKYPVQPPSFRFTSRIFHPNVAEGGEVCVDQLSKDWTPCHSAWSILANVQHILIDPNPDEPLNPTAALYFKTDRAQYDEIVKECVKKNIEEGDTFEERQFDEKKDVDNSEIISEKQSLKGCSQ